MSLIDISQRVSARSAVFPGDTAFSLRRVASMAEGASCDVGTITTTLTTASPATPGAALFADPGAVAAAASGGLSVTLPPYGSAVWRVAGGP